MKGLIERVFMNWMTTTVGVVIVGGALLAVYLEKATLTEAGGFITLGIGFFFMKDK